MQQSNDMPHDRQRSPMAGERRPDSQREHRDEDGEPFEERLRRARPHVTDRECSERFPLG